ncbi:MAG TPA: hypothetical protein VFR23_24730 [Jiangellaceae bacterium]|nr:hypothetical protein [Jiangellaceae bacterium]
MTLADDLLPVVYDGRSLAGEFGFRPYTVHVITTLEVGTHTGDAGHNETTTQITESGGQNPKVRWLNDEEIAVGGYPGKGVVEVGPITPAFATGGTELSLLTGDDLQRRDTIQLEIRGPKHPNGSRYRIIDVNSERPLRYMIRARPLDGGAWP